MLVVRLGDDGDLHAPHLVDIEVLHAIRRLWLGGELAEGRAAEALRDWDDLRLTRYPHQGLAARIWSLRHNLSAYDAAFVALAEKLEVPLVTCDAKLGGAPLDGLTVEVYGLG